MIYLKTKQDIANIKKACEIWKKVKETLIMHAKVGVTTTSLDKLAGKEIAKYHAIPSFLNYHGFPANICISVNEELIHGIPSNYVIKEGDMITFDVGVTYNNHVCDSAFTVIIGKNEAAQKISNATYQALMGTINIIKPNIYTGDIGACTEEIAQSLGYEVIKDFSGHGCGNKLHEDPSVPNYGKVGEGTKLKPNMTLCIEPMLMTGTDAYITLPNKWTIIAKNKKLTCHWEHMVLVTETGFEILTI